MEGVAVTAECSPPERARGLHCAELPHGELARHYCGKRPDVGRDASHHVDDIQAAHDALWHGRPASRRVEPWAPPSESATLGARRHLESLHQASEWGSEATIALNSPLADVHRARKWEHHAECQDRFGSGGAACWGGAALAELAQTAPVEDVLALLPRLEASCAEAPKEQLMRAALRLGELAQCAEDAEVGETLHAGAHVLLTSVVARARDFSGPEPLLEVLEAMAATGVALPDLLDRVLAALYAQLARAALPPGAARRAAAALAWHCAAADGAPVALGPAGRRVVAAVARALRVEGAEEECRALDALFGAAGPPASSGSSGYCTGLPVASAWAPAARAAGP